MNNWNLPTLRRAAWIGLALVLAVDFFLFLRSPAGAGTGLVVL